MKAGGHVKPSRQDVLLPFGEPSDGSIAHISEVASGLACACRCRGCGSRLVAKKGGVNEHHFAHHSADPCRGAYESALHKLAKAILSEKLELALPEIAVGEDEDRIVEREGGVFRFDRAELEVPFEGFQPDVVLYRRDRRLLVEVLVTHESGDEKRARIDAAGLSALEIDLSSLSRAVDREAVADALCHSAPRWWLSNPRIRAAQERWEARKAERVRQAAERAKRRRVEEERRLDALAGKVRRSLAGTPSTTVDGSALDRVREAGLSRLVDVPVAREGCFAAPKGEWQAAIVADVVLRQMGRDPFSQAGRHPTDIFKDALLRKLLKPGIPAFVESGVEGELASRVPEFRPPYRVLESYLETLAANGIITERRKSWFVTDATWTAIGQHREAQERCLTRRAQLTATIQHIIDSLPEQERRGFALAGWLREPLSNGQSPSRLLRSDDEGAALLACAIQLKVELLANGVPGADDLGLPIARARARAAVRRQEQEERAMAAAQERRAAAERKVLEEGALRRDRRLERLRRAATDGLGGDARDWLQAAGSGETAPEQLAARDDAGLAQALDTLEIVVAEKRSRERLQRLRDKLEAAARHSRRPDHAHVFLHSSQPRCGGMRPIDYCVDDSTFSTVSDLMNEAIRR